MLVSLRQTHVRKTENSNKIRSYPEDKGMVKPNSHINLFLSYFVKTFYFYDVYLTVLW